MAGETTPHAGENGGGWHSGRFAHTFAAIDLGTNNCRLLVARASVDGYEVIDAYSRPVRLGEGVALNGSLCGEAIERTLHALGVCASKIERHRVSRARHIATEACRRVQRRGLSRSGELREVARSRDPFRPSRSPRGHGLHRNARNQATCRAA